MSSSARHGRVFRAVPEQDEVYVHPDAPGPGQPRPAALATAVEVVRAAEQRAAAIVAEAEAHAAAIIADAQRDAGAVRGDAHAAGLADGRAEATAAVQECIDLARRAASEGQAVRDSVAAQASAVVARAVALATRRIVGEYYDADPARTAIACAEALRAAAGQDVLALRVNPAAAGAVQAVLVDAAAYVRPDDAIEVGGCIIDVRHGTIDATLDARFSLMELALAEAGGEVGR